MNTFNSTQKVKVIRATWSNGKALEDCVATEEPLSIRIVDGEKSFEFSLTMRTPGDDENLIVGFLFNEGVITRRSEIIRIELIKNNQYLVSLSQERLAFARQLRRLATTNSSCGVCSKKTVDDLAFSLPHSIDSKNGPMVATETLLSLSEKMKKHQSGFQLTGGIHASGLFDTNGQLLACGEDIGRHNSLDKVCGYILGDTEAAQNGSILLLSGRAGYEMIQKALMMAVPVVCSIGAPSHLAIELAETYQQTLIGFLKTDRFNIYSHPQRVNSYEN